MVRSRRAVIRWRLVRNILDWFCSWAVQRALTDPRRLAQTVMLSREKPQHFLRTLLVTVGHYEIHTRHRKEGY